MKQIFILKEKQNQIKNPKDFFIQINHKELGIDFNQENFIVFLLTTKNQILKIINMFKGAVDSVTIDPKIIFREALKQKCIKGIAVAHNHPSGDLTPSNEDFKVMESLKEGSEILDLSFIDSIIFNKKEFYSMKDEGRI